MQAFLGTGVDTGAFNRPNPFPGLKAFDPKTKDLEDAMLAYAFLTTDPGVQNPVTGERPNPHPSSSCAQFSSVEEYLRSLYGSSGYDFLSTGNSFRGELAMSWWQVVAMGHVPATRGPAIAAMRAVLTAIPWDPKT
jgi:hypothetical protein